MENCNLMNTIDVYTITRENRVKDIEVLCAMKEKGNNK